MFVAFPSYSTRINAFLADDTNIVVLDTDDMTIELVAKKDLCTLDIKNLDEHLNLRWFSFVLIMVYCSVECRHVSATLKGDIHYKKWDFEPGGMIQRLAICNGVTLPEVRWSVLNVIYLFDFRNHCILRCFSTGLNKWYSLAFDERGRLVCEWTVDMSYCRGNKSFAVTVDTLSEV